MRNGWLMTRLETAIFVAGVTFLAGGGCLGNSHPIIGTATTSDIAIAIIAVAILFQLKSGARQRHACACVADETRLQIRQPHVIGPCIASLSPALSPLSASGLLTPARFRPLEPPMFDSPTIAS
jgi:hypothetical protein